MKNVKMFILFGLFALILSGCSSDLKTVGTKEAEAIDVSDYFPPVGTARTYVQYEPDGKTREAADVVNRSENGDGPDTVYIYDQAGTDFESIKEYAVSSKEIKQIYIVNALKNEETAVLELANQPKWDKNDDDNSVSYITQIGMKITVPANTYEDVIEVTTIIPDDEKGGKIVHYYAPGVGLIKTVFVYEDGEEFTFSELKSAEMKAEVDASEPESETGTSATEQGEAESEAGSVEGDYSNAKYNFSFEMPADMLGKLAVKEGNWDSEAVATVDFTFTEPSRQIEQSLFSIIVFENKGDTDEWEHPVYKYVGANDSYIFAYAMSGDPSEEMLQEENEDLLKEAQDIVRTSQLAMDTFSAE